MYPSHTIKAAQGDGEGGGDIVRRFQGPLLGIVFQRPRVGNGERPGVWLDLTWLNARQRNACPRRQADIPPPHKKTRLAAGFLLSRLLRRLV
jgi:hypothetical protein